MESWKWNNLDIFKVRKVSNLILLSFLVIVKKIQMKYKRKMQIFYCILF